jgi:hypothetical protein
MNKKWFAALVVSVLVNCLNAQINYKDCDIPQSYNTHTKKANCSIVGESKETTIYVIQIGAYRNKITPFPNTICIPYGGLYRYYLNILFMTYEDAKSVCNYLDKKIYCDAKVVVFPIENIKGYR